VTSVEHPPLRASDGFPLAATLHRAREPAATAVVAAATGVPHRFYGPLAAHLAGEGFDVLSFDWRGIGGSRPARLRGFEATMTDWAALDFAAALELAYARGRPVAVIGHSFGGQAVGLAPRADELSALALVAAGTGYWAHWSGLARWRYAAIWHLVLPAVVAAVGYMPGRLGTGEDLPRGVALEWASWCRSRDYLGDWAGHARLQAPLLSLSFTDDAYAPAAAVDDLLRRYGSRERDCRRVEPGDQGVARIGHFGFFRPGLVPSLWTELVRWLRIRTSGASR
jgi:predicted alpha/beta hydrolase